jgi:sarcosine oxidase delta subunit
MSDWTLGAVNERGMLLEAYCQTDGCKRFFTFDLKTLIDSVGADYLVSDIPELSCEACGGPLEIKICISGQGE